MQIQSNSGSVVIDFYPIKTWTNEYITDKFLRILTFNGETLTKELSPHLTWVMIYLTE